MTNKRCLVYETLGKVSNLKIVDEGSHNSNEMRLHGVFGVCGIKNDNNRIYDKKNYSAMVESLQNIIKTEGCPGELEHPNSMNINLENVSHKIESIEMNEDGTITGTILLLNTPKGQIAKAIVEGGLPLYISSRGAGTVTNEGKVTLQTIKTYDLVGTPGFSQAKLSLTGNQKFESLNESLNDGNIAWAIINEDEEEDTKDDETSEDTKKNGKKPEDTKDGDKPEDTKDGKKPEDTKDGDKPEDTKDGDKPEDTTSNSTTDKKITEGEDTTSDDGDGTKEDDGDGTKEDDGDGTKEDDGDGTKEDDGDGTKEDDGDGTKEDDGDDPDKEEDNKNKNDNIDMEDLKKAIDVISDKVDKIQASLHIAQESLKSVKPTNYDAIQQWVTEEFAPEYRNSIMECVNSKINNSVKNIANGVEKWVTEEFAPEVQNWVTEEFAPEVQNWVTEEFAPEVQNWVTEEFAPEIQGWVTEEFAPEVQNWILEEYSPSIEGWVTEEFAQAIEGWVTEEFAPDVENKINENVSDYLKESNSARLENIDAVLETIGSASSSNELEKIVKETKVDAKFAGVYCVEHIPNEFSPLWESLDDSRKDEIVRSSRMYDFTKQGVLESFWQNVDFNKKEEKPINENLDPVSKYHTSIVSQMKRLQKA